MDQDLLVTLEILLHQFAPQLAGKTNPLFLGLSDVDVYSYLYHRERSMRTYSAIRQAAEVDRESMFRTIRGAFQAVGADWTVERARAVRQLLQVLQPLLPIMQMLFPGMESIQELIAGPYGSAQVAASRLSELMYRRFDPVTGLPVASDEHFDELIASMGKMLASREGYVSMAGMRAGQAAQLLTALHQQGQLPQGKVSLVDLARDARISEDLYTQVVEWIEGILQDASQKWKLRGDPAKLLGQLQQAAATPQERQQRLTEVLGGLSPEERRQLLRDRPQVERWIREHDLRRMMDASQDFARAVRGVQDILTQYGASAKDLVAAVQTLEQITAGAAFQMDPSRMAAQVQQMRFLLPSARVTLPQLQQVNQFVGGLTQAMGLPAGMGMDLMIRGMAQAAAFTPPAWTTWQTGTPQTTLQQSLLLGARTLASQTASAWGAMLRFQDVFRKDSDAARIVEALRQGRGHVTDSQGNVIPIPIRPSEIARIMAESGVQREVAAWAVSQHVANRMAIERAGMADQLISAVRGSQLREQIRTWLAREGGAAGLGRGPWEEIVARAIEAREEVWAEERTPQRVLARIAREMNVALREDQAELLSGILTEAAMQDLRMSIVELRRHYAPDHLQRVGLHMTRSQMEAELQKDLSPLRGTVVTRLLEVLQEGQPIELADLIGRSIGPSQQAGAAAFRDAVESLHQRLQEYRERMADLSNVPPEQREQVTADLEDRRRAIRQAVDLIMDLGRRHGLLMSVDQAATPIADSISRLRSGLQIAAGIDIPSRAEWEDIAGSVNQLGANAARWSRILAGAEGLTQTAKELGAAEAEELQQLSQDLAELRDRPPTKARKRALLRILPRLWEVSQRVGALVEPLPDALQRVSQAAQQIQSMHQQIPGTGTAMAPEHIEAVRAIGHQWRMAGIISERFGWDQAQRFAELGEELQKRAEGIAVGAPIDAEMERLLQQSLSFLPELQKLELMPPSLSQGPRRGEPITPQQQAAVQRFIERIQMAAVVAEKTGLPFHQDLRQVVIEGARIAKMIDQKKATAEDWVRWETQKFLPVYLGIKAALRQSGSMTPERIQELEEFLFEGKEASPSIKTMQRYFEKDIEEFRKEVEKQVRTIPAGRPGEAPPLPTSVGPMSEQVVQRPFDRAIDFLASTLFGPDLVPSKMMAAPSEAPQQALVGETPEQAPPWLPSSIQKVLGEGLTFLASTAIVSPVAAIARQDRQAPSRSWIPRDGHLVLQGRTVGDRINVSGTLSLDGTATEAEGVII